MGSGIARLVTIPGAGQRSAEVIVAQTGGDMTRFPTAARLVAWAGLAPGDNQSAGKRKRAPTRTGDVHLRTAMARAAWATWRTATPPRRPAPPPGPPVRQGQPEQGRRRRHPALLYIAWRFMRYHGDLSRARYRPAAVRVAQHHSQPPPVDLPQARRLLTGHALQRTAS
jgi:Transposase IS116/IS110/IS902 family